MHRLAVRGVMFDVARGRVPEVGTVSALIDRLADLGLNHAELYMEAAFAYPGHESVWRGTGAMTAEDIHTLDARCRAAGVELAPNQNTLGHMERWLTHARYRPLAATPEGWSNDRGDHEPATTLDPGDEDALAFAAALLGELVPRFSARTVHVGLDEPLDLNPEVWAQIYGESQDGQVLTDGGFQVPLPPDRLAQYLAWVRSIRSLPALDGYEVVMWGDVLAAHPEVLPDLPKGLTVAEWGYEADHPFDARCARLASAGLPFWVCPGTASWTGFLGRPSTMRANVLAAVAAGDRHGARGVLMTDWGTRGSLPVIEAGYAFATMAATQGAETAAAVDLGTWLDTEVFADATGTFGRVLVSMGDLDLDWPVHGPEMSAAAAVLFEPAEFARFPDRGLRVEHVAASEARLRSLLRELDAARPAREDADLLIAEVRLAAGLQLHALHLAEALLRAGLMDVQALDVGVRSALRDELAPLVDEQLAVWAARNRPEGSQAGVEPLRELLAVYSDGSG